MYNTIQNPTIQNPFAPLFDMMFFGDCSPEATERIGTHAVRQNMHEDDAYRKIRDRIRELYNSADTVKEDDSGEGVDMEKFFGDLPASPDGSTWAIATKTAFPKISRVVFNEPVTKVWFEDGTTSMVRASKDDTFSKEAGLAFAIVKRLYGTPDDRGNYGSAGYMMELKRIIDKAYDQTPVTRKREAEKAARRKAKDDGKPKRNSGKISGGKAARKANPGRKRSR